MIHYQKYSKLLVPNGDLEVLVTLYVDVGDVVPDLPGDIIER